MMMNIQEIAAKLNPRSVELFQNAGLSPTFQSVKNQAQTGYDLTIFDIIGTDETNSETFQTALDACEGAPITIHLSSPGGSVFDGITMYNSLRNYAGASTVVIEGVCASIATVFALGADQVIVQPSALMMIHSAWVAVVGNAVELRQSADILGKIDDTIMQVYAAKTGEPASVWATKMAAETWYSADEAVAAKLVDAIKADADTPTTKPAAKAMLNYIEEVALFRANLRLRRAMVSAVL